MLTYPILSFHFLFNNVVDCLQEKKIWTFSSRLSDSVNTFYVFLFCRTSCLHILLHCIHKSSLWSHIFTSYFIFNILCIQTISSFSQPSPSNSDLEVVSKPLDLSFSSVVLLSNLIMEMKIS